MLTAAIALGSIGLVCAVGLGLAAKFFYVEVDPVVAAVEEALPGANCGGCGFAGCSAAAEAIAAGAAPPNVCVASNAETHAEVAAIVGAAIEEREPELANSMCTYSAAEAETVFEYDGVADCRAAILLYAGQKKCDVGCLGLGSCVKACPFDALVIGPQGLPVVDSDRCTGCGTCVRICPNGGPFPDLGYQPGLGLEPGRRVSGPLSADLPGPDRHPGLYRGHRPGQARGGHPDHQGAQPHAAFHRPGLPPPPASRSAAGGTPTSRWPSTISSVSRPITR